MAAGEGFEVEAVNARDEASLYLRCLRCKRWEVDLGCYPVVAFELDKINEFADAHEHECPEVR